VLLRLLVRDNQVDYLRAVLHQLPYYIPPVILANLINILIFALIMGAVELLPNLLLVLSGSPKVALPFTLHIYNYYYLAMYRIPSTSVPDPYVKKKAKKIVKTLISAVW
jgi:hypothetical protein